jgi:succinate-semialdehyde dehydrogenase / glutarate-semialdehyde dehydrogenase
VLCKYRNSGQTCISANRILVQDGIYDAYLDALVQAVTKLKVGSGTEPDVNVGPLIDDAGFAKVRRHVEEALQAGAGVMLGGSPHALGRTFFEPTVLVGVTPEMAMSSEETFGPVAGIARFATEDEAIRAANDTPYGLAAYFYSRDVGRVWRVSEGLDYGIVGINTGFISTEVAPFGGVKESGIGREGSKYGIEDWVELKYLAMAGLDA